MYITRLRASWQSLDAILRRSSHPVHNMWHQLLYLLVFLYVHTIYREFRLVVLPYSIPYLLLIRFSLRRHGAYSVAKNTTVAMPWVTSNGKAVA